MSGRRSLYDLAHKGHIDELRDRLAAGEHVDTVDSDSLSRTALHGASGSDVLMKYSSQSYQLNQKKKAKKEAGRRDILDLVLSYNPRLDLQDENGLATR